MSLFDEATLGRLSARYRPRVTRRMNPEKYQPEPEQAPDIYDLAPHEREAAVAEQTDKIRRTARRAPGARPYSEEIYKIPGWMDQPAWVREEQFRAMQQGYDEREEARERSRSAALTDALSRLLRTRHGGG